MNCIEIKDPEKLVKYCREDDDRSRISVFKCFYALFFEDFKKIFWNYCVLNSSLYTVEEQLKISFINGQCKFYEGIVKKGWEEHGATVKTALFTFCFNQLRALTKFLRNQSDHHTGADPKTVIESVNECVETDSVEAEEEARNFRYQVFVKAFGQLDEKCRDFIRWRRLFEMSDTDMKTKYPGIDFTSRVPTDIAFRCVQALKKIVANLGRKN